MFRAEYIKFEIPRFQYYISLEFFDLNQLLEKFLIEFYKYVSKTLMIPKLIYYEYYSEFTLYSDITFYNESIYFKTRTQNMEKNDHICYSNILKHVYNKSYSLKKELNERLCKFNYFNFNKELIEKVNHPKNLIKFLDNGGSIDDFEYIYG